METPPRDVLPQFSSPPTLAEAQGGVAAGHGHGMRLEGGAPARRLVPEEVLQRLTSGPLLWGRIGEKIMASEGRIVSEGQEPKCS